MNVDVETNFFLELVFQQEQTASCEELIELCRDAKIGLILPAHSIAEANETLVRRTLSRNKLQGSLKLEITQLARTIPNQQQLASIQNIDELLTQTYREERARFIQYRQTLLETAEIIPLTAETLAHAARNETRLGLTTPDAVVYASTLSHLQQHDAPSCFLNRNARDFDNPQIKAELAGLQCFLIYRFDQGVAFVRSQIGRA